MRRSRSIRRAAMIVLARVSALIIRSGPVRMLGRLVIAVAVRAVLMPALVLISLMRGCGERRQILVGELIEAVHHRRAELRRHELHERLLLQQRNLRRLVHVFVHLIARVRSVHAERRAASRRRWAAFVQVGLQLTLARCLLTVLHFQLQAE